MLLLPRGLLEFPPFRGALHDLIIVLIIVTIGCLVQRIAGNAPPDKDNVSSQPRDASGQTPELLARDVVGKCVGMAQDCRSSNRTYPEDKHKVIVTLVHGTFQRGATWVSKDSEFSEALRRTIPFPVEVQAFRWSGKNSHAARIAAAEQLREHVLRLRRMHPESSQVCIGHSHGGSLLYYALSDAEFETALQGYAFLSTPFLHFQNRNFGHLDATEFFIAGLAVFFVSIPSYVFALWNGWSLTALTGPNPTLIAALLVIPFAVATRFYRHFADRRRRAARDFIAGLPKSLCTLEKSLFLRTPADEASNILGIIYTVPLLQVHAQLRMERYLERLDANRQRASLGSLRNPVDLLVVAVIVSATALWSALCSLICVITFSFFGWDIAIHSFFLQVTPEVTPPGTWSVTQLNNLTGNKPSEVTHTFAHSSYAHPEAAKLIGRWISGWISQRDREREPPRGNHRT